MKDKKDNNKDTILKGYIDKFKEAWKDPHKKAGIKLGFYVVFFIIFFIIAAVSFRMNNDKNIIDVTTTTTTKQKEDKYYDKQNKLLKDKYNVNYNIISYNEEYKITGILDDNIVNGYLEYNNNIKKITIEDNNIFESKNNEKQPLELNINYDLVNVENIINLIKDNKSIIERKDNYTNYFYTINIDNNDAIIKIYTNKDMIYKIEIRTDNNKYILNFDK